MKHINQARFAPSHKSVPQWPSPGLTWFPARKEKTFSSDKSPTPFTTEAHENNWKTGRTIFPSVTESEQILVAQSRAGCKEAFEQLVLHHKDRVYTLACRVLGNHGEAEDVAQETFLRAYEYLADFRGEARFSTWLYRLCYNLCVNRFRRKNREASNISGLDAVPNSALGSCEQLLVKEQQHLLNRALSRLKAELREVVLLYHTDHLSYEEIASVVGHPVGTVRSRLHRGREELKVFLQPYFAEA